MLHEALEYLSSELDIDFEVSYGHIVSLVSFKVFDSLQEGIEDRVELFAQIHELYKGNFTIDFEYRQYGKVKYSFISYGGSDAPRWSKEDLIPMQLPKTQTQQFKARIWGDKQIVNFEVCRN